MQQANPGNPKKPIVLTGAWGGGKTTVLSELAAERGRYCILAEAAPSARSAGHDPSSPEFERHVVELQHSMEEAALRSADGYEAVLTHRGSLDALAFWRLQSNPAERFFEMIGSSHSEELERYRAVILLQSAARGALDRYLSYAEEKKRPPAGEAVILELFLEEAWREHPCFFSIANEGMTWERKSRCAKAIVNAHSSGAERPSLRDVNSRLEAITYPSTHQYMLDALVFG